MDFEDVDDRGAAPKERKPYVLSKTRESWSAAEHILFQEALQLFHRDWKHIEAHIGTKSVVQVSGVLPGMHTHRRWQISRHIFGTE